MNLLILVVDDEPDVEALFRQQFRRDLRNVDTQPSEFTEFRIVLPRAAASANKSGGRA